MVAIQSLAEDAGHPYIGCSAKPAEADHGKKRGRLHGPRGFIHGAPEALQHIQARAPHHAAACSLVCTSTPRRGVLACMH
jgi:hypothetical protein